MLAANNESKEIQKKERMKLFNVKTLDIMNSVIQLKRMYKRGLLLRLFNDKTSGEKKLDLFLYTVPISSNYRVEPTPFFGFSNQLFRLNTYYTETSHSIGNHIKVKNLTDECMIRLTEGQFQMYNDLCKLL
jgi:hypothetical protein